MVNKYTVGKCIIIIVLFIYELQHTKMSKNIH